jgi:predicted acyl esterase
VTAKRPGGFVRRGRALLAVVALLSTSASLAPSWAATLLSGNVSSEEGQQPLANVNVGVTRATQVASLAPGSPIPVEWSTTTDASGDYSFTLDETLPGMEQLHVYSWHHTVFNELNGGVDTSGVTPLASDLALPGVVTIDLTAGPATGIDFEVASSLRNELVTMNDGVTRLATDIWLPSRRAGLSFPVLLNRTPYDTLGEEPLRAFSVAGYAVLQQNTRGRHLSEGTDEVFDDDGWRPPHRDGYDTVEWIAAQPWSNGKVGTFGLSAHGITQYLLAGAAPPSLVCGAADFASGDFYNDGAYPGGEFRKHMIETWLADQGSLHKLPEWQAHPTEDAYWIERNLATRIDQVRIPMLHIGGWYDVFADGTLRFFREMQDSGAEGARRNQKLLVGPWTHSGYFDSNQGELLYPLNSVLVNYQEILVDWYGFWMKGEDTGVMDDPPVRYYVMGPGLPEGVAGPGNDWRDAPEWPPATTATPYYLQPGGTLSTAPPASGGGESVYTSDPAAPVPTDGGGNLYTDIGIGPIDQAPIDNVRADVLVWESLPLTSPLEVTGKVEIVLYASSDRPDTDWVVKLEDRYADGRAMLVTDHILKARHRVAFDREDLLTPGTVYEFRFELWPTSITFNVGHRIRIAVASSNYPRFEMNPQTGEPFNQHTSTEVATNRIQHSAAWPSHVVLPVADPVALTGCRPSEAVDGLTVEKLMPGQIRLSWNPVTDGCHRQYRVYAGIDGPEWPMIVRRPVGETTDTFFETTDAGVFWQVVSEGTDGGNGPHGPPGSGSDGPGKGGGPPD